MTMSNSKISRSISGVSRSCTNSNKIQEDILGSLDHKVAIRSRCSLCSTRTLGKQSVQTSEVLCTVWTEYLFKEENKWHIQTSIHGSAAITKGVSIQMYFIHNTIVILDNLKTPKENGFMVYFQTVNIQIIFNPPGHGLKYITIHFAYLLNSLTPFESKQLYYI